MDNVAAVINTWRAGDIITFWIYPKDEQKSYTDVNVFFRNVMNNVSPKRCFNKNDLNNTKI